MDTPDEVARKALNAVRRERYKRKKQINASIDKLAREEARRQAKAGYKRMLKESRLEAEVLAQASVQINDVYFPRHVRFRAGANVVGDRPIVFEATPDPSQTNYHSWPPEDAKTQAERDEAPIDRGTYASEQNEFLNTASPSSPVVGDGLPLTNMSHPRQSWVDRFFRWLLR